MNKVKNVLQVKDNKSISVTPDTTVFQSLQLMVESNVGALLVMEENELVGIFTERDYARKVILAGKSSKQARVSEVMTANPITVTPDHTIEECMWLMTDRYIRHLPVTDNGNLLGIISIGDLVGFIIKEQKSIIGNLEQYIRGNA
jgi:CBS domain-containing protein